MTRFRQRTVAIDSNQTEGALRRALRNPGVYVPVNDLDILFQHIKSGTALECFQEVLEDHRKFEKPPSSWACVVAGIVFLHANPRPLLSPKTARAYGIEAVTRDWVRKKLKAVNEDCDGSHIETLPLYCRDVMYELVYALSDTRHQQQNWTGSRTPSSRLRADWEPRKWTGSSTPSSRLRADWEPRASLRCWMGATRIQWVPRTAFLLTTLFLLLLAIAVHKSADTLDTPEQFKKDKIQELEGRLSRMNLDGESTK